MYFINLKLCNLGIFQIGRPKFVYNSTEDYNNSLHDIGYHTIAEFISEGVDPTISYIDDAIAFGRKLFEVSLLII